MKCKRGEEEGGLRERGYGRKGVDEEMVMEKEKERWVNKKNEKDDP